MERNFQKSVNEGEKNLLPLVMDLTNPSPSKGWAHQERMSLVERGPTDAVLSLALIHHLAISNNVPVGQVAEFFAQLAHWLIIEFVLKEDSHVGILLASREDIFPEYTIKGFTNAFTKNFTIHRSEKIDQSPRTLYLMEKK